MLLFIEIYNFKKYVLIVRNIRERSWNRSTNEYRRYNNYSATRLRITRGDHDKRRNWFEDHVRDRAVNDKSKCANSEVKDTVRSLYIPHIRTCRARIRVYINVVLLVATILLRSCHSDLHMPILDQLN